MIAYRLPNRVEKPIVMSAFPSDIIAAPRSYAEHYINSHQLSAHESDGHVAVWERPDECAADLPRAVDLSSAVARLPSDV